ncbi:MAG: glycoside hydrolase family 2 protein [Armatimonadetes bacterium]|nr:glycoside hydrolase family 2 protein [Armatimonadota bacterium]
MSALGFWACLLTWALLSAATTAASGTGRQRIRFDADWRFLRGEDPKPTRGLGQFTWEFKMAEGYSSLKDVTLPMDLHEGAWAPVRRRNELQRNNTCAWFRTNLGAKPSDAKKVLRFEAVDDNCLVFLNGVKLIEHSGWNDPFDVPIASAWNPSGPNTLVVFVENQGGEGGIAGPVSLEPLKRPEPKEALPGFDDTKWRTVHLPHDYVVEGAFKAGYDASHGSLPTPTAWYRKTFDVPKSWKSKSVYLDFDGVYRNSTVWLNGHKLGTHPSGYIGVRYDVTKHLRQGENKLAVFVDPRSSEGWWYEGGGLYRHVWLTVVDPVHAKPWGTFVKATPQGKEGLPRPDAIIDVACEVVNASSKAAEADVTFIILDPKGKKVAELSVSGTSIPTGEKTVKGRFKIGKAHLWSTESPNLYTLHTTVRSGDYSDVTETTFGIRSFRFDADKGFFLNGKPVKLMGTCNHQDHAGVGVALPDSLLAWRIKKLKEMGSNAYRCAHNPPAEELLDACDRLGMIVMDETRHLGDVTTAKTGTNAKAEKLTELRSMIRRDRNHPSIVMWSLFNEEPVQGSELGKQLFLAMKKVADELDGTRPCTGAINHSYETGIVDVNDLLGVNYNIEQYDRMRKAHPRTPVFGSETGSTVSTRGIYANDRRKGYVSAYDVNHPEWAETAERAWKPVAEHEWNFGAFVWTGFDYKGEPTPYGWPCINSHFGIMDICGFPKDNWWYYRAHWNGSDGQDEGKPMVHILPHWNWQGKEGQPIDVWCHTNAEMVELFLNGKTLGVKKVPKYGHAEWKVPFAPGTLKAVAYNGDKQVARDEVSTTGAPASIRLSTDWQGLLADREDLAVVKVEILDAQGRVVPTASNEVSFSTSGPGAIAGVGNGDPSDHDPDRATKRKAFNGLCMALVQATDKPGTITRKASSPGLKGATLTLQSKKPVLRKGVKHP